MFPAVVKFFFNHLLVFDILRVEASQKIKCRGGNGPPLSLFSRRWSWELPLLLANSKRHCFGKKGTWKKGYLEVVR